MEMNSPRTDEVTFTETDAETRHPPMYKVLLHNDHYTTMDFVVRVLETVFHKKEEQAVTIMLHVHQNGIAAAGVYPYQVAETKVDTVHTLARQNGFPLKCSMEPE